MSLRNSWLFIKNKNGKYKIAYVFFQQFQQIFLYEYIKILCFNNKIGYGFCYLVTTAALNSSSKKKKKK